MNSKKQIEIVKVMSELENGKNKCENIVKILTHEHANQIIPNAESAVIELMDY